MVRQVFLAPANPQINLNDLRRIAQAATAAQQGDLTFQGYWKMLPLPVASSTILGAQSFVPVDSSGGDVDLTLPDAAASLGLVYVIKKADGSGNAVNITPAGTDTLDGGGALALTTPWGVARIFCDGTQWLTW